MKIWTANIWLCIPSKISLFSLENATFQFMFEHQQTTKAQYQKGKKKIYNFLSTNNVYVCNNDDGNPTKEEIKDTYNLMFQK